MRQSWELSWGYRGIEKLASILRSYRPDGNQGKPHLHASDIHHSVYKEKSLDCSYLQRAEVPPTPLLSKANINGLCTAPRRPICKVSPAGALSFVHQDSPRSFQLDMVSFGKPFSFINKRSLGMESNPRSYIVQRCLISRNLPGEDVSNLVFKLEGLLRK